MVLGQGLFYLEIQKESLREGAFKMGWGSVFRVVSYQGGLLSGWSFIRVVFH